MNTLFIYQVYKILKLKKIILSIYQLITIGIKSGSKELIKLLPKNKSVVTMFKFCLYFSIIVIKFLYRFIGWPNHLCNIVLRLDVRLLISILTQILVNLTPNLAMYDGCRPAWPLVMYFDFCI